MRVALGQLDMVWEDKVCSYRKAEGMAKEAAAAECDVIIFPEMSFTGFSMNLDKIGEPLHHSQTVEQMQKLAKKLGIAVAFGWAALGMEAGEKGTNPFLCFFSIDFNCSRLTIWVINTDFINETTVSWRTGVSYNDTIERRFLCTHSFQSDFCCHDFHLL